VSYENVGSKALPPLLQVPAPTLLQSVAELHEQLPAAAPLQVPEQSPFDWHWWYEPEQCPYLLHVPLPYWQSELLVHPNPPLEHEPLVTPEQ
jgi:hypothetical protein